MSSEWIIGALALMTIGGVLALSILHFGFYLKDPKNLAAAKSVAEDRESAATALSSEGVRGRSLRRRLDEAPALSDRLSNRPVGSSSVWDAIFYSNYGVFKNRMTGDHATTSGVVTQSTKRAP